MPFPSPHPGIINFFSITPDELEYIIRFPSPHPGIINFFCLTIGVKDLAGGFRPLIRGLSISSEGADKQISVIKWFPSPHPGIINFFTLTDKVIGGKKIVSVPSSGDYQFLRKTVVLTHRTTRFPSPHPGIINFFKSG